MIDIKSIKGDVLVSVPITKECIVREELMSADYISLSWVHDTYAVLPAGAYVEYNGERYSLLKPYSPTMKNEVSFEYKPQFQSRIMRWQKIIVPVYTFDAQGKVKTREFDWVFTGTPSDLLTMINRAILNETGEVWNTTLGEDLPETVNVTAQSSSVWSLLSDLAEQCKTEWWVDKAANWLYLSKCSHGVDVPLEVGKEVGVPSVTQNNTEYFTRFYAFGSARNMTQDDGVVEGSVVNKRLTLDPKKYPHGYKDVKGHFENGVFVSDLLPEEVLVTSLYFEDIYPSSNLSISNVRKRLKYRLDDEGNKIIIGGTQEAPIYEQYAIWYFKLPTFTFSDDLIIEGLTLSAAFRSGKLQGREFELAYHAKDKKVADVADVDAEFSVSAGEYEIIFDESGSMIIPDDDYIIPENGDEVTLFNINLPDEYINSARFELEMKLNKEIEERLVDNNSYEFSSNPVAFSQNNIVLTLGQKVAFTNGSTKLSTRVMMIEKSLDFECQQKIRIGNVKISGSRQQLKDEVREVGEEVSEMNKYTSFLGESQRNHSRELMISMGRYFAMRDTIDMLQNAVEGYTEGISPITVETMALMVGDESLQFRFTSSRNNVQAIPCPLVYNESAKQLNAQACSIVHMTLDVNAVTAQSIRSASEYHSWDMSAWHGPVLEDPTKKYYVYAKVEKDGTDGTYVLSETAIGMKSDANFYHLLIGILNAEYAQVRELVTLYGFTEVRPGQISTDVIQDSNKNLVIDLLNATITAKNGARIQGDITFGPASEGLSNVPEWQGLQEDIDETVKQLKTDAEQTTNELNKAIEDAEKAAKNYTDEGKAALQKSINELDAAKAGVNEVYTKAQADNLVNSAEQRAGEAAEGYASEAKRLAEETAKAYTDGEVDAAEAAAIAEAEKKVNAAKKELNEAIAEVEEIANTAKAATTTLDTKITNVETGITESVNEINARLDGVVENYFEEGVPTTSNYPANEWKTDKERANHVGDTYTNISSYEADPNNAGKSWRWTFTDSEHTGYHWHPIADSDAVKALLEASKAKTAADGKARNFVTQPKPPYSVGDTWMQGATGEIMRCKVARETGSYTASDWEIASKYTDDTKANEAKEVADQAKLDAQSAVTAANNAKTEADNATARLNDWASDSKISKLELQGIKDEYSFVIADKKDIDNEATRYGVTIGSLTLATTSYTNALLGVINAFGVTPSPDSVAYPSNLTTLQGLYYTQRTNALASIAAAAKKVADDAAAAADDAATAAQEAKEAAEALEQKVADDYGYLHDTFGQVTSGQVFLAKLMGVGTGTDTAINAYMDGSGLVTDSDDGKLMLATGIPSGSGTLASRAAEASTRIYEKGKIVSNSIELDEGCKVGGLNVGDGWIGIEPEVPATSGYYDYVLLRKISLHIGRSYFTVNANGSASSTPNFSNVLATGFTTTKKPLLNGAEGFAAYHSNGYPVGFQAIDCKAGLVVGEPSQTTINAAADGKYSVYASKGVFAGFRPNIRVVTTSAAVLTNLDYTIIADANCTITLPTSPLEGQCYRIIRRAQTVKIQVNGSTSHKIVNLLTNNEGTNITPSSVRMMELVWDGSSKWYFDGAAH